MGLIVASSYGRRVQNLRQLISFLQLLESEIQYARTTLPNVITFLAPQFSGAIGEFLTVLCAGLSNHTGERFSTIWDEGVQSLGQNGLPQTALDDLRSLGSILGTSDAVEQSKHLKHLLHRLDQALKVAEEEREKQTRLWQYLGFSAGMLIVLLLI